MHEGEARTAYPRLEIELGRQVREARLDHETLQRPLKLCELTKCRATCCHDGVFLSEEEERGIRTLLEEQRDKLASYGWDADEVFDEREGRGKTQTVAAADGQLADDFPEHFPKTRCVFLDKEHRCVLQRLAMDEKKHPWWWKPFSCWLHPLLIRRDATGRPVITLAQPGKDPSEKPGYSGFGSSTHCGTFHDEGPPAWKTLQGELEMLGGLSDRNLLQEFDSTES